MDRGGPGKPAGTEIWPLEIDFYHSYVHSSGILVASVTKVFIGCTLINFLQSQEKFMVLAITKEQYQPKHNWRWRWDLTDQQYQPRLNWAKLKLTNYYYYIPNITNMEKYLIDYNQLELNWRWGREPLCYCYRLVLNIFNTPEEYFRPLDEWLKEIFTPLKSDFF